MTYSDCTDRWGLMLRMSGDSTMNASITDGDPVLVRQQDGVGRVLSGFVIALT